jgi:hypothetical protein
VPQFVHGDRAVAVVGVAALFPLVVVPELVPSVLIVSFNADCKSNAGMSAVALGTTIGDRGTETDCSRCRSEFGLNCGCI